MKKSITLCAVVALMILWSSQTLLANAGLMTMMVAMNQIQQMQAAEAQKRAAAPAAIAATFHDTLGRAPSPDDIQNGLNHLSNGGTLEQLRTICATSPEAQTNISTAVKNSTGKDATQADVNNGIQHLMTGGTFQGYSDLSKQLGTSAVPNVAPEMRQQIWNNSMNGAIQHMPNPSQLMGGQ